MTRGVDDGGVVGACWAGGEEAHFVWGMRRPLIVVLFSSSGDAGLAIKFVSCRYVLFSLFRLVGYLV